MKKLLILCVIFGIYHNWPILSNGTSEYSENNVVILYATDWCGYCKKTRELLKDNNIQYTEFDIEKSEEGRRRYDELGGNGIPLLNINGSIVNGYSKSQILKLLK
ncbi:glutaredoxin family protein [Psychromonas sp.]|uniref:glutaredoxin family protein n=1 Tax=Psychromonas sp. TaxID=1884585 RepID=UPI0039E4A703